MLVKQGKFVIDVCMQVATTTTALTSTHAATTAETTAKTSTVKASSVTTSTAQVTSIAPTTTSSAVTKVVTFTTSTTPQVTSSTTLLRMPQRALAFNQTDDKDTKATEALRDYEEVEDEREVSEEPDFQPTGAYESDNFVNERYMMKETKNDDTVGASLIIKVCVIAISTLFLSLIVFVVAYHQYKKSTNPLNYKEKSESGSKKVNEEFSEIRFLTSDETLDFNLATLDNATEL